MIRIEDKKKCCGCTACYSVCPVDAIDMVEDNEGFLYPKVNSTKCIKCGLCEKICPYNKKETNELDLKECFVAFNKNDKERYISSSGGIFILLAKKIVEQDGIVFGSAYDDEYLAEHICVDNEKDLEKLIGSKYMQSRIGNSFSQVKKFLQMDKKVLFVGSTCQIAGLKSFLKRDYENLICVDFICLGTPSPKVWKDYLDTFFENELITAVNFKDKKYGWNNFALKISTDKKTFCCVGKQTYYFTGYYNFLYSRPSCSNCIFKGNTRASDITLSDCWGYANIAPEMTDNNGLSCIVCHSPKGKNLYNEIIKDVNWKKMSFDDLIKYNSNYNKSAPMGERRESFWDEYNVLDKKELFAKYCSPQEIPTNNNIVKKIVEGFKRIIGAFL